MANEKLFKALFFINNELPVYVMDKVSRIPGIGTTSLRKTVKQAKFVNRKAKMLGGLFDHFTIN